MTRLIFDFLFLSIARLPINSYPNGQKTTVIPNCFSGEEPAVVSANEKAGSSDLKVFGMTWTFFKSLHCSQPQSPVKRLPKTPKITVIPNRFSGEEPAF